MYQKGCQFNSWSEHMPRLQVHSLVGVHAGGSGSILLSCILVSLSLSPPLPSTSSL